MIPGVWVLEFVVFTGLMLSVLRKPFNSHWKSKLIARIRNRWRTEKSKH